MARPASSLQPWAKFIVEVPNSSCYNAKLSKAERTMHGPRLHMLQEEGASRHDMQLEGQASVGRPVTLARLDGLLEEHDISFYKKQHRNSNLDAHSSDALSSSVISPLQRNNAMTTTSCSCADISSTKTRPEILQRPTSPTNAIRAPASPELYASDVSMVGAELSDSDGNSRPSIFDDMVTSSKLNQPATEKAEPGSHTLSYSNPNQLIDFFSPILTPGPIRRPRRKPKSGHQWRAVEISLYQIPRYIGQQAQLSTSTRLLWESTTTA
ncbi:uncharacterized protein Z519_05513 [Cladophialophora bantiana CBS 173.52]|uniref:Uncharacterized protein n=1 Tax=Cladophialophora bantiana (strain ATCC 10958 / CBS 173.52 / CDC B-1940 / NIH 8579) TaxID=1442370 RepID=A0A0D2G6H0_CLAB1|nr:uncharacterized protein Z519_05513 [Cladophialophora bantiana CBS 173.52]KIW94197.1 hypothetical protein Z519_05513 [Cladophialophora bantiana CBS 173.52]